MAVRNDFSSGEVLTAADLNDTFASKVDYATPTNAQTGTAYTFVADDAERLTTASNGSAVTFTVPPQSSVAWGDDTILRVVNYGAGALTVAGGSGVTVTNTATVINQFGGGAAIRTGSDAWTFVPFGAGESPTFEADFLVEAGGGGGGSGLSPYPGGGGGGGVRSSFGSTGGGGSLESALTLTKGTTYTITVGAGGPAGSGGGAGSQGGNSSISGSDITTIESVGGGSGGGAGITGGTGGSGGGGGSSVSGGSGTTNQGYAGASGTGSAGGGGGGAGAAGSGGTGGSGITTTITASSVTYGQGGNGGDSGTGSKGGNGATSNNGLAGSVVIRSEQEASSTTGTVSLITSGSTYIYVFTGSGSITY